MFDTSYRHSHLTTQESFSNVILHTIERGEYSYMTQWDTFTKAFQSGNQMEEGPAGADPVLLQKSLLSVGEIWALPAAP